MINPDSIPLGASYSSSLQDTARFLIWAPNAVSMDLVLTSPVRHRLAMTPIERGYFFAEVDGVKPGSSYHYSVDGARARPDPASRRQADGVHGDSLIERSEYRWKTPDWRGLSLEGTVLYEVHAGTFSGNGFLGIINDLPRLHDLGIDALQLMPIGAFPGHRNWGYDGVLPYAVQSSYGSPDDLRRLVDACHSLGIGVILDVVYNHLGPEGNYLCEFGPYFSDHHRTPWGSAIHFDDPEHGSEIRRFFLDNAVYWLKEFRLDGLRLDAVHTIYDRSAKHFLEELRERTSAEIDHLDEDAILIAESGVHDSHYVSQTGHALSMMYNDEFHHNLHVLLTGEQQSYYAGYGGLRQFQDSYRYGFSPKSPLAPVEEELPNKLLVFSQNHDQIGNRPQGDRLTRLCAPNQIRLAAACTLLHPSTSLLFMGEEYGERAPFHYFIDHSNEEIIQATRDGRREEFGELFPGQQSSDPGDPATFDESRLVPDLSGNPHHHALFSYYRELIDLRKALHASGVFDQSWESILCSEQERLLLMRYSSEIRQTLLAINFSPKSKEIPVSAYSRESSHEYRVLLDSSDPAWRGNLPSAEGRRGHETCHEGNDRKSLGTGISLSPYSALVFEATSPKAPIPHFAGRAFR